MTMSATLILSVTGIIDKNIQYNYSTKHLYDFMQCWTNVENVGPTLHKCHTNVLRLLGRRTFSQTLYIYLMLVQCWASVADVGLTLKQHWINVLFE